METDDKPTIELTILDLLSDEDKTEAERCMRLYGNAFISLIHKGNGKFETKLLDPKIVKLTMEE